MKIINKELCYEQIRNVVFTYICMNRRIFAFWMNNLDIPNQSQPASGDLKLEKQHTVKDGINSDL